MSRGNDAPARFRSDARPRGGQASVRRPLKALACGLLAAAASACAATPPELARPSGQILPFHVAIVPVADVGVRMSSMPDGAQSTSMLLELAAEELSTRLAEELDGHAFTRVTLLPGVGDPVALARAERADLILECDLEYEEPIWRRRTRSLAMNYLLFAIGGPFGTALRDTEFLADAELTASLYEVGLIDESEVMLGDSQARVLLTESSFPGLALSFNERREGTSGFWKAFFVPTAHLAKESPAIQDLLQDQVCDHLTRGLARTLVEKRQTILERGRGSFFSFDPNALAWTRRPDGRVRVTGTAVLRPTGLVERLSGARVLIGEQLVTQDFGAGRPDAEGSAYDLDLSFAPGAERYLRLELQAGGRDPVSKSYSFDLRRVLPAGS